MRNCLLSPVYQPPAVAASSTILIIRQARWNQVCCVLKSVFVDKWPTCYQFEVAVLEFEKRILPTHLSELDGAH